MAFPTSIAEVDFAPITGHVITARTPLDEDLFERKASQKMYMLFITIRLGLLGLLTQILPIKIKIPRQYEKG